MADRPTPDMLRRLLRYEPETGKLFWRERPVELCKNVQYWRAWNTRFAGREAFVTLTRSGYLQGVIFNRIHLAHKVIWAMAYDEWPSGQIDHRDTNPSNNSLGNLRGATGLQNSQNQGRKARNTSGYKGVTWSKKSGRWQAQIMCNWKTYHLGLFDTPEEAHTAYCAAARRLHGEFYNDGAKTQPERKTDE
mgnify:CR=1 FL=1